MSNTKAIKSYQGFEEGSYAARKGRLCQIKKIHFEMHPPSVTVLMKDTDTEVGTEFDRLKHIKSWFCDVCTAQNNDTSATKCSFCKMDRSFKEKLIIQDENEQNNQQQSNKQMEKTQEYNSSENTKQSESTELILSAESDETEPDETVEQEPEQQENEIDDEYEIINAPQHKQPQYEQEEESEPESESEDEEEPHTHGYRERPVHNGYYYDEDEYAKYQHRNRMNRNRDRMNRNRNAFGFGGWNAFPSFDRFFL